MCGICGVFQLGDTEQVTKETLKRMNQTLHHRGPDDGGVWVGENGRIGLANRRLAIIDLSPAGHQPLSNEDGTVWIAYNGEVYNYQALRARLELHHQFRSNTDTETLIHLYEDLGDEMVHHLRGMFAFALWDACKNRLLIVRDRMGIKPLYYSEVNNRFLFASEIKALFASGYIQPKLNRDVVSHYLALGYVPTPHTLFEGISKLEPGHLLIVDKHGVQKRPYWDIYQDVVPLNGYSEIEYLDMIATKLEESVKLRLVADVPTGVFLSGGIDSSLIAAFAARHTTHPIKTFTLGFRDHPEYNELLYARQVAKHLGAEAYEILIGPEEVQAFFPRFLEYQEEPVANPIWFATYFVSKLARDNGVIVVLSGDGGDELYAGYNKWMTYLRLYHQGWKAFKSLPSPLQKLTGGIAQSFLPKQSHKEIIRRGMNGEELFWGGTLFKPEEVYQLLSSELLSSGSLWHTLPQATWHKQFTVNHPRPDDYLPWMSYTDLKGNLLEDFLMRLDKMGMAASIEGRVPFLDHEFITFSLSIPSHLKYPNYQNKYLLRQVARRLLPMEIVDRPKQGFCAPIESWLTEAFGDSLLAGLECLQHEERLFKPNWLTQTQKQINNGYLTSVHWGLLSLGQWYMQWIHQS